MRTNFVLSLLCASFLFGEPASVLADEPGEGASTDRGERSAQQRRRRRRRTPTADAAPDAGATEATAETPPEPAPTPESPESAESRVRGGATASTDVNAAADGESGGEEGMRTTGNLRRSNRMEFDTRLVRGQTAGAGAVVLFNRGSRPLPPLTGERRGFTRETVRDVIGAIDRSDDARSRTNTTRRWRGR